MMVAQTAGTLFDIGLEMEDGVAVFLVTHAGEVGKPVCDAAPFTQRNFGQGCVLQHLRESVIPGDEPPVQQGEGEFDVVRVVTIAFLEGANHGAGPQSEIPHGLIATTDVLAKPVLHFVIGAKIKQIDVGTGEEFLTSEAAYAHQRQPGWDRPAAFEAPQWLQQAVDD